MCHCVCVCVGEGAAEAVEKEPRGGDGRPAEGGGVAR